jgi:hypothetical protein
VNASLISGLAAPWGIVVVPEPSTWAMLATGTASLLALRCRKSAKANQTS